MRSKPYWCVILFAANAALFAGDHDPISAGHTASEGKLTVATGAGYLQARAHELVYPGPSANGELSRLVWDTEHAVAAHAALRYAFSPHLAGYADLTVALAGDGHLVDYDWLGPDGDWTDRSTHPDTDLDHHYRLDTGMEWRWMRRESITLSALAGFRYTDVSWTARGGRYVYSTDPAAGHFRDEAGAFAPGEPAISYRQKLPGVYVGPRAEWVAGKLTLSAGAVAGLTFGATDRDHHWDRNLLFVEDFDSRGFFEVSLGAAWQFTDATRLFLDARYDRYPLMKGSTRIKDTAGGSIETHPDGSAGARLESWLLRAGVEVRF